MAEAGVGSAAPIPEVPQFAGGGPVVNVRNTFINCQTDQAPAPSRRVKTAPPRPDIQEVDLPETPACTPLAPKAEVEAAVEVKGHDGAMSVIEEGDADDALSEVPELPDGGHVVTVKNTFLDLKTDQAPAPSRRVKTAPPRPDVKEPDLPEAPPCTLLTPELDAAAKDHCSVMSVIDEGPSSSVPLPITVRPYGVLGSYMLPSRELKQNAPEPDPDVVFLDPAGLHYIQSSPYGASGASGEIYKWLGISMDPSFPDSVQAAIQRPLQAKFHAYGDRGEKKCVHVVGPNFSANPCSRAEAVEQLSTAYRAALSEFGLSGLRTLRLLPVSGGIFAGAFAHELPAITAEALRRGFNLLSPEQQVQVTREKILEMCIFMDNEFADFERAFSEAAVPAEPRSEGVGSAAPILEEPRSGSVGSAAPILEVPQFTGSGPVVKVRNTFLDFQTDQAPAPSRRVKTAPPRPDVKEADLPEMPASTLLAQKPEPAIEAKGLGGAMSVIDEGDVDDTVSECVDLISWESEKHWDNWVPVPTGPVLNTFIHTQDPSAADGPLKRRVKTAPPAMPKTGAEDEELRQPKLPQPTGAGEDLQRPGTPEQPQWVPFWVPAGPSHPAQVFMPTPYGYPSPAFAQTPEAGQASEAPQASAVPQAAVSAVPAPPAGDPAEMSAALKRNFTRERLSTGEDASFHRVQWSVDGRAMDRTDINKTSPAFDLSFGGQHQHVLFRMILLPAPPSNNFRQAHGKGFIQLKCEAELDAVPDAMVHFRFSVGSGKDRQPMRGPVAHNFQTNAIGALHEDKIWDFKSLVDLAANSFVVTLEVIPAHAAVNAGGDRARAQS